MQLVQLHTFHRYFKGDTPEVGAIFGLMSGKLHIGTTSDKFREKLKSYVEINIYNAKYVMCVVMDMEDTIKTFGEYNMQKYLDEGDSKSILNHNRSELEIIRNMDREEKNEENINQIYGIIFG